MARLPYSSSGWLSLWHSHDWLQDLKLAGSPATRLPYFFYPCSWKFLGVWDDILINLKQFGVFPTALIVHENFQDSLISPHKNSLDDRVHGTQNHRLELTVSTQKGFEKYAPGPEILIRICQNPGRQTKPAHFETFLPISQFLRWNPWFKPVVLSIMNPIIGGIFFLTYSRVHKFFMCSEHCRKNSKSVQIYQDLITYP